MDRQLRLAVAKTLRRAITGYKNHLTGICDIVEDDHRKLVVVALRRIWVSWPEFSGNETFPVPHPTLDPVSGFLKCLNAWEGEYGDKRRELAQWLVDQLESDNGEYTP